MKDLPTTRPETPDRGPSRLIVTAVFATIPVYPAAFLFSAAVAVIWTLTRRRRLRLPGELKVVWVITALGCAAQILGASVLTPARPLDGVTQLAGEIEYSEGGNLVANTDLAGTQPWSAEAGFGAFAEGVVPGFWRLRVDSDGSRFSEARALQEVSIQAGIPYTATAIVRHDGSEFLGRLLFRTREGWQSADEHLQVLGPGVVRLESTLPARPVAGRLRSFQIVDLDGDWTTLDIGLVSVRAGVHMDDPTFSPRFPLQSWFEGVWWWVGTALFLSVCAIAVASESPFDLREYAATGLLFGLGIQLIVVVSQLLLGHANRFSGTLSHPNLLAHAAVVAGMASVAVSRRPRPAALWALALVSPLVVLSGSDAGLVAVGLATVTVVVVLAGGRRTRFVVLALTVSVLAVLALLSGPGLVESVVGDPNNIARTQAWGTVAQLAAEYPIAGVGTGNFAFYHEFAVPKAPGPRYRVEHAHTIFGLAAENGLLVMLSLMLGLAMLLRQYGSARLPLMASTLVIALALNVVDLTFFNPAVLLPWWVVHFICAGRGPASARGDARSRQASRVH